MEYEEFCTATGAGIDREKYKTVEEVYMCFDRFICKDDFYLFYRQHGLTGVETLAKALDQVHKLRYARAVKRAALLQEADELRKMRREIDQLMLQYGIDFNA